MRDGRLIRVTLTLALVSLLPGAAARAQRTTKPVLHGRHWVAITGKPLAATAGAPVVNAIFFDRAHGTLWGGSAIHGEDYEVAW
jgi:hypothetical protein